MSVIEKKEKDALDVERLSAQVLNVPGVTNIYPPAPSLGQIPMLVTAAVTGTPPRLDQVSVITDGATTELSVRVGTSIDSATPHTATLVANALLENVPDGHEATVKVRISRIA